MNKRKLPIVILSWVLLACMLLCACNDVAPALTTPEPAHGTTDPATCHHTHVKTGVNSRASTCVETGYSGDTVCADCGTLLTPGVELSLSDHTWNPNGVVTKEPTCTETGTMTVNCKYCAETKTETIRLIDHKFTYTGVSDTEHRVSCSNCTLSQDAQHTPLHPNGTYVDATCETGAYVQYVCALCNETYYKEDPSHPAKGHTFGDWTTTVTATCTTDGVDARTCSACNTVESRTYHIDRHTYTVSIPQYASCTAEGILRYTCQNCGNYYEEAIAKTEHTFGNAVKDGDYLVSVCKNKDCQFKKSVLQITTKNNVRVDADKLPQNALEVTLPNATVRLPKELLDTVRNNANMELTADTADTTVVEDLLNQAQVSEADKATLKDTPIYDFSFTADGTAVGTFPEKVKITLPYTLQEGESKEGVCIWYIGENGPVKVEGATYFEQDGSGYVTFETTHFSFYAVVYVETGVMHCRKYGHTYAQASEVVAPSCLAYGYSVYSCTSCGAETVRNFTAPAGHAFGAKTPVAPTCTERGYSFRVCKTCQTVSKTDYVKSLGHKLTSIATCTQDAVCGTCHEVVTPKSGHAWTAWEIVQQPSETVAGVRRRYCPKCGTVQDQSISSSGEALDFTSCNSYTDLFRLLCETVCKAGGEIELSYVFPSTKIDTGKIKFACKQDGADMLAALTFESTPADAVSVFVTILYKNGTIAAVYQENPESGVSKTSLGVTDLDALLPVTFQTMKQEVESLFDYYNALLEVALAKADVTLEEFLKTNGSALNELLAAAGLPYTTADAVKCYHAAKTLYATIVTTLGFQTDVTGNGETIELPSAAEWIAALQNFLTIQEENGNTSYLFSLQPLTDAMRTLSTWILTNKDLSLEDALFALYQERIQEIYPTATDTAALEQILRTEFPGTLTVKEFFSKLTALLGENLQELPLEPLLQKLDAFLKSQIGEDFDLFATLLRYYQDSSHTVNDFLTEVTDGKLTDLADAYDKIFALLKQQKFGDLPIPLPKRNGTEITLPLSELAQYASQLDFTFVFSVTVDTEQNLKSVVLHSVLKTSIGSPDGKIQSFGLHISYTRNPNIQINIPKELQPYFQTRITYTYDENGNLVIKGLPSGVDFVYRVQGELSIPLSEILESDPEMSKQLGFHVYRLPREMWNHYENTLYLDENGVCYVRTSTSVPSIPYRTTKTVGLGAFLKNPTAYLPKAGAQADAILRCKDDTEVELFYTPAGYVYLENGTWYVLNLKKGDSHYSVTTNGESNITTYQLYIDMDSCTGMPYSEFTALMASGNFESLTPIQDTYRFSDLTENIFVATYTIQGITTKVYLLLETDGSLSCVRIDHLPTAQKYAFQKTGLTEADLANAFRITETDSLHVDGKTYRNISLYLPDYYIKIGNEYLNIGTLVSFAERETILDGKSFFDHLLLEVSVVNSVLKTDITGLRVLTLDNGSLFYVLGTEEIRLSVPSSSQSESKTVEAMYGYLPIGSGYFLQAFVYTDPANQKQSLYLKNNHAKTLSATLNTSASLFSVEPYPRRSADGTVTIDHTFFEKLRAYCTEPGNLFYLTATNGTPSNTSPAVYAYTFPGYFQYLPYSPISSTTSHVQETPSWDLLFIRDAKNPRVVLNKDGNLEIIFGKHDEPIYLGIRNLELPAAKDTDYMVARPDISSQLGGLPIYAVKTTSGVSVTYLYTGGKYYQYDIQRMDLYTAYAEISLGNYLDNYAAMIRNLEYYAQSYEEDTDQPNGAVYRGFFSIGAFDFQGYFLQKDGKLLILPDAHEIYDEEAETEVLSFSTSCTFTEFVNRLTVRKASSYKNQEGRTVSGTPVYRDSFELLFDGEPICNRYLSYLVKNTTPVLLRDCTYTTSYTLVRQEAVIPENFDYRQSYTEEFANGTFTFVTFHRTDTQNEYYTLAGGKFYRVSLLEEETENGQMRYTLMRMNGGYADSSNWIKEHYTVLKNGTQVLYWTDKTIGEAVTAYAVYRDGSYYIGTVQSHENGFITFTEEPSQPLTAQQLEGLQKRKIANSAYGDVYIVTYLASSTDYTTYSGYLKLFGDWMISAEVTVLNRTGEWVHIETNFSDATHFVSYDPNSDALALRSYFTLSADGLSATLTRENWEKLKQICGFIPTDSGWDSPYLAIIGIRSNQSYMTENFAYIERLFADWDRSSERI